MGAQRGDAQQGKAVLCHSLLNPTFVDMSDGAIHGSDCSRIQGKTKNHHDTERDFTYPRHHRSNRGCYDNARVPQFDDHKAILMNIRVASEWRGMFRASSNLPARSIRRTCLTLQLAVSWVDLIVDIRNQMFANRHTHRKRVPE